MDRRKILLVVATLIAALGIALVFVYARGAESRAAERFDTVQVLRATQEIAPGESVESALEGGKIALEDVARDQVLEGASDDSDALEGQVALTTIYPGEQLIPVKFGGTDEVQAAATLPIPAGKLAISVNLTDPARVGSFTQPGAQVSVFLTQEGVQSRLLLPRVTVVAAGSATSIDGEEQTEGEEDGGPASTDEVSMTLALNQREAEKVLFGQSVGQLSFALLNDNSDVKPGDGVGPGDLFE